MQNLQVGGSVVTASDSRYREFESPLAIKQQP